MIEVEKITLTQFRNYGYSEFSFTQKIVCFCGLNGSGKTNLLDAIHYLCFSKSYFSKPDAQSSHKNLKGFRIEGSIRKDAQLQKSFACCVKRTGKNCHWMMNPTKVFCSYW